MDAGALDRRVTIRRQLTTDDGYSSTAGDFADLTKRWASKRDIADGERWSAGATGATVTTRFVMRWDSVTRTITAVDRLFYDDAEYDIVGTKEIERRQYVEITAARRND